MRASHEKGQDTLGMKYSTRGGIKSLFAPVDLDLLSTKISHNASRHAAMVPIAMYSLSLPSANENSFASETFETCGREQDKKGSTEWGLPDEFRVLTRFLGPGVPPTYSWVPVCF